MIDTRALLRTGLAPFFVAGSVLEIRILKTPKKTVSGYFSDLDRAVQALEQATRQFKMAPGFYVTLNPIHIDCQARALNHLKPFADYTSTDADVVRRQYLLIDCDPKRPAGTSSTDAELAAALARRDAIVAALTAQGWPAPIRAMSGNGGHALYQIDLPNTAATRDLVRNCLQTLARRFADAAVEIDTSVYNAARIVKAYGTMARKGDDTSERPHRRSAITDHPEVMQIVTAAQLEQLAQQTPARPTTPSAPSTRHRAVLDFAHEFEMRGDYLGPLRDGKHAVRCPWRDGHSGDSGISETVIFEPAEPDAVWGFKCQHASCSGRTSRDVWELFRPTIVPPSRPHSTPGPPPDDPVSDLSACRVCGRESCEEHLPSQGTRRAGLPREELEDAVDVAAEGQQLAAAGVRFLVKDIVPNYGLLGFLVAYSKVGKTTFGNQLGAHVAGGRVFLGRATTPAKVLVLSAEDPPEYTAWNARHLEVARGRMLFRRKPIHLGPKELEQLCNTIAEHQIGLVLIASWQAVVRGLIRDENDNAGAVAVVENVKAAARRTGIPWLIDAHAGKGEDQADEADPSRAMRGASSAQGAADYSLSLRYSNGTFGTLRRLSGKGRFVNFAAITVDFDQVTGQYSVVENAKAVVGETTWQLIVERGALTDEPQSAKDIARTCGLVGPGGHPTTTHRRQVHAALQHRPEVGRIDVVRRGQKTVMYRRLDQP